MSRPTAIAVAVVLHGELVLVGRRHPLSREGPGLDEFPGGKVEPGEHPAAAAARECLEESGLAVTVGRLVDVAMGRASFGPIEVSFFLAEPTVSRATISPSPASTEPPAVEPPFAWRTVAELASLTFPETNARVVAMLASGGLTADRTRPDATGGSGRSG